MLTIGYPSSQHSILHLSCASIEGHVDVNDRHQMVKTVANVSLHNDAI